MTKSRAGKFLAAASAACGLAAFGASAADAALIMDLRITGGTMTILNPKTAIPSSIGDFVTLALFAQVSGTDGVHDELMRSAGGSVISIGPLHGDLAGSVVAPFNGASSTNGSVLDIDSDGDLDLGSTGSTSIGKLFGRANSLVPPTGVVNADTSEIQLAQLTFTATSFDGPFADLTYVVRTDATGGPLTAAALWFEDNNSLSSNPSNSPFAAGTPVRIGIPEPASLGLLALSAIGLLERRTRQS